MRNQGSIIQSILDIPYTFPINVKQINTTTTTTTVEPVFCYTGKLSGIYYEYIAEAYKEYDDLVIATLRSRGIATYSNDNGAVYEVTGLTDVTMDCSGSYSAVTKNPFSVFGLNVTNNDGENFFFERMQTNKEVEYGLINNWNRTIN